MLSSVNTIFFINQYASLPSNGFAGRYYYLAKEFSNKDYKSVLICSSNHHLLREKPVFKGFWNIQEEDNLTVIWLKTLNYKKASSPLRVVNWFLFSFYLPFLKFSKYTPSFVSYSSPSPVGFLGAWILAKFSGALTTFDVRDVWPETLIEIGGVRAGHPFVRFLSWLEKFCYRKSDVITSNLANFDKRLKELDISGDKFMWIANGVNEGEITESERLSNICLPKKCKGKFVVAYTGTIGEANALDDLIDAAIQLRVNKDIHFLLIGSGGEEERLERKCIKNKLDNVTFYGSLKKSDAYKMQSLVDVLCVGAKSSPLYRFGASPNKLYEYMYSRTPVIYYINTPDYSPVADAKCGLEVKSGDGVGLKEAILKLKALKSEEYQLLGESGRNYIENQHTYSGIANKLENLLLKMQLQSGRDDD